MIIYWERLIYVVPAGVVACLLLNLWIEKKNQDWLAEHPGNERHPYSPLFVAIGVLITCACLAFIIPAGYALVVLGAFCLFGACMWALDIRRWRRMR